MLLLASSSNKIIKIEIENSVDVMTCIEVVYLAEKKH